MSDLTVLETERLRLSGWTLDQLPDLVRLHGDPEVARYLSPSGLPWSEAQAAQALRGWIALFNQSRLGKLRVTRKSDGVLVGRAGFGVEPSGEPEIGYALYPDHWGMGYGLEAAAALRDWIFRETDEPHFLGMADVRNGPSLRVLRAIGMTPTHVVEEPGRHMQYHILRRPN